LYNDGRLDEIDIADLDKLKADLTDAHLCIVVASILHWGTLAYLSIKSIMTRTI
jgi:hypothetical protein